MLNGYTFSKHCRSMNFYCSKKNQGCKAKVKMGKDGRIVANPIEKCIHNHAPPKYAVTSTGFYFKIAS
ncbi:unnamed protein product, partial [Iphiclides podalirius]